MRRIGPIFWPLLLIALGVLFLLSNLNLLPFSPWDFWRLWPLILVVIGLDILLAMAWPRGQAGHETLAIDQNSLPEAQVSVEFGAGELRVEGGAAPGKLLEGEFTDDVEYQLRDQRLKVYARPYFWDWWGWKGGRRWSMRLTRDIPLKLRFQVGACQSDFDLSDLRVSDFSLECGAADARVRFPRQAGTTRARVQAGAASVRLSVPEGVAARISATVAIGSFNVDTQRFVPSGSGYYATPDYDTAANKLDLSIEGGMGQVTIR